MRKLFSLLLLAIFVLPLVCSFSASTVANEAGVAACCRRNGAHHCSMSMGERTRLPSPGPAIHALAERCPFCPGAVAAPHLSLGLVSTADAIFAALVSHPAAVAQTESMWRIARDRSRGKRGPPVELL